MVHGQSSALSYRREVSASGFPEKFLTRDSSVVRTRYIIDTDERVCIFVDVCENGSLGVHSERWPCGGIESDVSVYVRNNERLSIVGGSCYPNSILEVEDKRQNNNRKFR
jgi:hypothetical protein